MRLRQQRLSVGIACLVATLAAAHALAQDVAPEIGPPEEVAPADDVEPPVEMPAPPAAESAPVADAAPDQEEPPPLVQRDKPQAVAVGSFLQGGVGPAWDVSAPAFDRYRDELFEGKKAPGRVTWARFAWSAGDTPAYFQAGMMRSESKLSEGYDGGSFSVSVSALSVDLGVGAQWTAPDVNPFSLYGDAALAIISADTVAEGGAGTQRDEGTHVEVLLRGGLRVTFWGPLAADAVLHLGGMTGQALTGGLSYVF